jgi:hypothetical protein
MLSPLMIYSTRQGDLTPAQPSFPQESNRLRWLFALWRMMIGRSI